MVAGGEDLAAAAAQSVEVARGGDHEGAEAVAERALVVCLDEQVDVVVLDAGVDDAEVGAADARGDRALDGGVAIGAAKAADVADDAQRDVLRLMARDVGTALVRRAVVALARTAREMRSDQPLSSRGSSETWRLWWRRSASHVTTT